MWTLWIIKPCNRWYLTGCWWNEKITLSIMDHSNDKWHSNKVSVIHFTIPSLLKRLLLIEKSLSHRKGEGAGGGGVRQNHDVIFGWPEQLRSSWSWSWGGWSRCRHHLHTSDLVKKRVRTLQVALCDHVYRMLLSNYYCNQISKRSHLLIITKKLSVNVIIIIKLITLSLYCFILGALAA